MHTAADILASFVFWMVAPILFGLTVSVMDLAATRLAKKSR